MVPDQERNKAKERYNAKDEWHGDGLATELAALGLRIKDITGDGKAHCLNGPGGGICLVWPDRGLPQTRLRTAEVPGNQVIRGLHPQRTQPCPRCAFKLAAVACTQPLALIRAHT